MFSSPSSNAAGIWAACATPPSTVPPGSLTSWLLYAPISLSPLLYLSYSSVQSLSSPWTSIPRMYLFRISISQKYLSSPELSPVQYTAKISLGLYLSFLYFCSPVFSFPCISLVAPGIGLVLLLNMELDLRSFFGLHVMWCEQLYSVLRPPQPPSPHLDSYTRALLVSQDRRHLLVLLLPSAQQSMLHGRTFRLIPCRHGGLDYKKGARCNPVQSAESGAALATPIQTPSESAFFQQCCDISISSCVVSCISVTLYLYSPTFCVYPVFACISLCLDLSSPISLFPFHDISLFLCLPYIERQ